MSFREYEIKKKPLFASMKRAKVALMQEHTEACKIEDFFSYLERIYERDVISIEYVTFYDYTFDGFHYNIAYIYTEPSIKIRDLLFEEREQITRNTGWYPMVSGSRANFTTFRVVDSYKYWDIIKHKPPYVHLGKAISIKNVAKDISSTALLLQCEKGNILLDTGFGIEDNIIDKIDFIFLSHFHRDHSGGLYEILQSRSIPIILSGITLEYLLNLECVDIEDKKRLLRNAVLIESIKERSYIKNTIEFFESYHCPGAHGLKYKFYEQVLIYPGDVCLINGFYDYSKQFNEILSYKNKKVSVITDCALLPRGDFSITNADIQVIIDSISLSENIPVFVSRGEELLFSIYIYLFKKATEEHKNWLFVVSEELFYLLKNILRTWLLPEYKNDSFIEYVIGKSHINYAETQRLYTISNIEQFKNYKDKKLIFLLTLSDLNKLSGYYNTQEMELYVTGALALDKRLENVLDKSAWANIRKLSSPDWSFHSDKEMLIQFIKQTSEQNIKNILFHAFPKVIKKFVKEFPVEIQSYLESISKNEVEL